MEKSLSQSSVSSAPPSSGCVSCNAEVEYAAVADGAKEDLSVKELAAEDDESSMEEPEVKLGGEELSEKDESVAEAGRGRLSGAS
jgi:hypothetical protein